LTLSTNDLVTFREIFYTENMSEAFLTNLHKVINLKISYLIFQNRKKKHVRETHDINMNNNYSV
jgi:hypothetical protein